MSKSPNSGGRSAPHAGRTGKGRARIAKPGPAHDHAQLLAIRFKDTLAAIRSAAVGPVIVACGLLAFFWTTRACLYVVGLLALSIGAFVCARIVARVDARRRPGVRTRPSETTLGLAALSIVGGIWGSMPIVLFAKSDAEHRLVVAAAVMALMGFVYRLGSIQKANVAYLVPICIGSCIGVALAGTVTNLALAALLPAYGALLLAHCARVAGAARQHIADRLSAAEQGATIQTLLFDAEEETSDWLWKTDAKGFFIDTSGEWGIGGLDGGRLERIIQTTRATSRDDGASVVLSALTQRKPFRNQHVELRVNERSTWWRLSGKPLFDDSGRFLGYRGVGSDETDLRHSKSQMAQLANFDALTGFANRAHFQTVSTRLCGLATSDGRCRTLILLDIDDFKSVNDRLGHEGADRLLRQVAKRLTAAAPRGAFIARLGGDEFALLLQPTTPVKAAAAARALIEALNTPFDLRGRAIAIGASVGIAFTPKHTVDPDDLLVKADLALYRAKAETKGQVCVFEPAFETSIIERRKLEGDLKLALARGEFSLHYQPILDVVLGRVLAFEALIRWQSPDRGIVLPANFIPAAERMGMIVAIGRWVLLEACKAAVTWSPDVQVAVNVSPPHVLMPGFLSDVTMALRMSGLAASRLQIEVTEGLLLENSVAAREALKTLRAHGVRIALDDFGTGYSSLNYLIDFPIDKIKIDRSFVRDFVGSYANQAVIDAILDLARKLSIRVTAEGVETKEQAVALKQRRCDELQGYLLSRPRPGADVPAMIESVPALFRDAVPKYMDSPLAFALMGRR